MMTSFGRVRRRTKSATQNVWSIGRRARLRRAVRRNRVLLVTLLAVGVLVAALSGMSAADYVSNDEQAWGMGPIDAIKPARFGAATTWDISRDETVVFGGFGGGPYPVPTGIPNISKDPSNFFLGDTWVFKPDQDLWQRREPVHRPSGRGFATMVYNPARKNVVMFGGRLADNTISDETWIWDGKDWTKANPPEPRPPARRNGAMAYDAHRKVVVMFGGTANDTENPDDAPKPILNDTWTWDGSAWKLHGSAGGPTPRHSAAMAYDACRAEAVMFGGTGPAINNFDPAGGQTWVWNGAKWRDATPEAPAISPTRRKGAGAVYSHKTGRVLLYGGLTTSDTRDSIAATDPHVWYWDGAKWEMVVTTTESVINFATFNGPVGVTPPPRAYAGMAYDPLRNPYYGHGAVHIFGGVSALRFSGSNQNRSTMSPDGEAPLIDQHRFSEDAPNPAYSCANPVPIPSDGTASASSGLDEAPQEAAREGMREIAQFPVLIGADWPQANRDPKINNNPNPNYIPPPDCPNRLGGGEDTKQTNRHLATDPTRNRVYQFFICDPARGSNQPQVYRMLIGAYDATTLRLLGTSIMSMVRPEPGKPEGYYSGPSGDQRLAELVLHDPERGRFMILSGATSPGRTVWVVDQALIGKVGDPTIHKINLAGAASDVSFFNHPKTGRAKLLINRATSLHQVDLETNAPDWSVNTPGCTMGGDSYQENKRAMRSGDRVYNACSNGVVRVPITENQDGSETPGTPELFLGLPQVRANWGDPDTERMAVRTGHKGGKDLWVFDGRASRYVGRAGLSTKHSGQDSDRTDFASLDLQTGRFYYHQADDVTPAWKLKGGVLMVDTRLTPAPQAVNFVQFASIPGSQIAILPPGEGQPRRIFTRRAGGQMRTYPDGGVITMPEETFYRVLADEVAIPKVPDLAQLDALTVPVPEKPGKTEATFEAEGSGYGIRLRSVGGIWSALRPMPSFYGSVEGVETSLHQRDPFYPACMVPDRELMAGWVPGARLSDLDAAARSTGLEVDTSSKTDLDAPVSRCAPAANAANFPPTSKPVFDLLWPLSQLLQLEANKAASTGTIEAGKDADGTTDLTQTPLGAIYTGKDKDGAPTAKLDTGTGTSWGRHFRAVECAGDDIASNQSTVGNIYGSAKCVQKQGLVEASAKSSAGAGPASDLASQQGFSVGEGYSKVSVTRDPTGKGVIVTANSVATGIKLPGLSIARVTTQAVAWSNGRPGEERAQFKREICGVVTPDYSNSKCLSATEQQDFVNGWNSGWQGNSKMYLPTPDPDLLAGSPGGYIAGVIKPLAIEVEDQLFAKDFQREVPGLVIEFYKDSLANGIGRQVLQLAAVRAVAGLGVQCNPELVYSPSANDCVAIPEDALTEEFLEEEEQEYFEDEEPEPEGGWSQVGFAAPSGESIGKRIGRFIQNLPIISRLPIRQIGEALLAWSVWLLLSLPLLLAWRRMTLNLGGGASIGRVAGR